MIIFLAIPQTDFEKVLSELNINNLEVCGAQTEYCVDATIKMAHGLSIVSWLNNDLCMKIPLCQHNKPFISLKIFRRIDLLPYLQN